MTHMLHILGLACLTASTPAPGATDANAVGDAKASSGADAVVSAPATADPAAGLRVVVDPETGEIIDEPTAAQLGRLDERRIAPKRRPAEELRSFSLAGGGEGVFLDGWADHALAVKVTADGKIYTACSQGDRHGETGESDQ